jgi:hypothetical protein
MSVMAVAVASTLLRPPQTAVRRWVPYTAVWIASGMLTLRGIAGMLVDSSQPPLGPRRGSRVR